MWLKLVLAVGKLTGEAICPEGSGESPILWTYPLADITG